MFQDNAEKEEQIKRALRDKRNVEAELEKVGLLFIICNKLMNNAERGKYTTSESLSRGF